MKRKQLAGILILFGILALGGCGGTSTGVIKQVADTTTTTDVGAPDGGVSPDTNGVKDVQLPNDTTFDLMQDTGNEPDLLADLNLDSSEDAPALDVADDVPAPDTTDDMAAPDTSDDMAAPDTSDDMLEPDAADDASAPDTSEDLSVPDEQTPDVTADVGGGDSADGELDTTLDTSSSDATGDDATGSDVPDAGSPCKQLSNVGSEVLISEIYPDTGSGQGFIELYNPTNAEIDLSKSDYALFSPLACAKFEGGGLKIPAGGYLRIVYPATFSEDSFIGGELLLYKGIKSKTCNDPGYDDSANLIDFVCWGAATHTTSRKSTVEGWGLWSGVCVDAPSTSQSIQRLPNTTGTSASSYTTSGPTDASCAL